MFALRRSMHAMADPNAPSSAAAQCFCDALPALRRLWAMGADVYDETARDNDFNVWWDEWESDTDIDEEDDEP